MKYKLKQNMFYQVMYQMILLLAPLIVSPYISRKLGAANLGIYSYTNSIITYFSLFAQLGISNHGCRYIAAVKDDIEKRNKVFLNIYCVQIITSVLTIAAFGIFYLFSNMDNKNILAIQGIILLANLLDISWYFWGIEKFRFTAIGSSIVKIVNVLLILIFVKDTNDLISYALIMSFTWLVSAVILWIPLLGTIKSMRLSIIDIDFIKKNLKPILVLFVPILASSIYHVMDKTMLGAISTYEQLGFYCNADKVINIPIGIFTGMSAVMMPYLSQKKENTQEVLKESFKINVILGIAMTFGIASVVEEFVPLFFGNGYEECIMLVKLFLPVFLLKILSMFSRMQVIIPQKLDNIYLIAVICGALSNGVLNYILIEKYKAAGAVIATFVAELVVCVIQCIGTRKQFSYNKEVWKNKIYIFFGIIMLLSIWLVEQLAIGIIEKMIFKVITGGAVYLALCYGYEQRKMIKKSMTE